MILEMNTVEASPPAFGSWASDRLSSLFAGAAGSSHSYQEADDNFLHRLPSTPSRAEFDAHDSLTGQEECLEYRYRAYLPVVVIYTRHKALPKSGRTFLRGT